MCQNKKAQYNLNKPGDMSFLFNNFLNYMEISINGKMLSKSFCKKNIYTTVNSSCL
jgi:hypothetical protein